MIRIPVVVDCTFIDFGALRVRLFIPDLLNFNFWILGLPPEVSHPRRHINMCDDRGLSLQADVQGSKR